MVGQETSLHQSTFDHLTVTFPGLGLPLLANGSFYQKRTWRNSHGSLGPHHGSTSFPLAKSHLKRIRTWFLNLGSSPPFPVLQREGRLRKLLSRCLVNYLAAWKSFSFPSKYCIPTHIEFCYLLRPIVVLQPQQFHNINVAR